MSNPNGVPNISNSTPYPTRPCWTVGFTYSGEPATYTVNVLREAEARSRFYAAHPGAEIESIEFTEVPF